MLLLDVLDEDLLQYVFQRFGTTPEAFLQRARIATVCKRFWKQPNMLMQENNRCSVSPHMKDFLTYEKQGDLSLYDADENKWVKIFDLRRHKNKFLFKDFMDRMRRPTVYRHPLTWKFVARVNNTGVMIQASSFESLRMVNRAKIPPNPEVDFSTTEKTEMAIRKNVFCGLLNCILQNITTYVNKDILHLSLKDLNMDRSHMQLLGDALPQSSIRFLNISSISTLCIDPFKCIFDNASNLRYLNINANQRLSQEDTLSCIHMLKTTTNLEELNMQETFFDQRTAEIFSCHLLMNNDYFFSDVLLVAAVQSCKTLRVLSASFITISNIVMSSYRLTETLSTLYSSHGDGFIVVAQDSCKPVIFDDSRHLWPTRFDYLLQYFAPVVVKGAKRATMLAAYKKKNAHRSQLIPTDRTCKYCGVLWPAGSIKIQTFEGLQSHCKLGKKKCRDTIHFHNL